MYIIVCVCICVCECVCVHCVWLHVCRAKHPVKVHVWAGISLSGSTGICVFSGIMKAPLNVQILEETLLPFLQDVFPTGHRFMQDNDPKHTSRLARAFFVSIGGRPPPPPPESPDSNPIENLWHEFKEHIRREMKPHTKDELVARILDFWKTVDRTKCTKYIRHLRKVLPKIIELDCAATGY